MCNSRVGVIQQSVGHCQYSKNNEKLHNIFMYISPALSENTSPAETKGIISMCVSNNVLKPAN